MAAGTASAVCFCNASASPSGTVIALNTTPRLLQRVKKKSGSELLVKTPGPAELPAVNFRAALARAGLTQHGAGYHREVTDMSTNAELGKDFHGKTVRIVGSYKSSNGFVGHATKEKKELIGKVVFVQEWGKRHNGKFYPMYRLGIAVPNCKNLLFSYAVNVELVK